MFLKTNIAYLLIRTHTCAYQGVKNVSFLGNVVYVLSEWLLALQKNIIFAHFKQKMIFFQKETYFAVTLR